MEHSVEMEKKRVLMMEKVFNTTRTRKIIVSCFVESEQKSKSNIHSARRVSKAWLTDTTEALFDSGRPLYYLSLNAENSLYESDYVQEKEIKMLENFTNVCITAPSPTRATNVIPPFSLSIDSEFFVAENRQSFSDFLTNGSAAGLMHLEMDVPKNGGSMDFVFRENCLSFPILQKLQVHFCEEMEDYSDDDDDDDSVLAPKTHGSNSYFVPFLQTILHGASQLKEFHIPYTSAQNFSPAGIGYLTFPKTLTRLHLECVLTSSQLEGLTVNSFPSLRHLLLTIPFIPFADCLIFKLLDKCKSTLRTLKLDGIHYNDEKDLPKAVTHFAFPLIENLKEFVSNSINAELEVEPSLLQNLLPKLNIVYLANQSLDMFRKWTENSCFTIVSQLTVGLVNDNVLASSPNYQITLRLEEMQALHRTFPNVSTLKLTITGTETSGLVYLFKEMQQLKLLSIMLMKSDEFTSPIHWDSLFTGLPYHVAGILGKHPELWEHIENVDLKENKRSLKNLIALQSLHLISLDDAEGASNKALTQTSLISDVVFHTVLLKMPTLQNLYLKGRFKASLKAAQAWQAAGRSISNSEMEMLTVNQTNNNNLLSLTKGKSS